MTVQAKTIPDHLEQVAAAFRAGVLVYTAENSPLYATLAGFGAEDVEILELASNGIEAAAPVHLFIAVHYLLLGGIEDPLAHYFPTLTENPLPRENVWPDFRRFCLEHEEEIRALLRTRTVQMTYVERCRNVVAPMAYIADLAGEPLNIIEIGCSAGVLLTFDRYAYELREGERVGPEDAPFLLKGEVIGGPRLRIPRIGKRVGMDLNIIDTGSEEDRRWMLATCFPELLGQQKRLGQAMDIVAETDISWFEGDALAHMSEALVAVPDPVCVYHSACLFYWPAEALKALDALLCKKSEKRIIYRFGVEPSDKHNDLMSGRSAITQSDENIVATGDVVITRYEDGKVDSRVVALSNPTQGKTWWHAPL